MSFHRKWCSDEAEFAQNSPSTRLRAWRIKQREYKTKIKEHELEKHANQNHRKSTCFDGMTFLVHALYFN